MPFFSAVLSPPLEGEPPGYKNTTFKVKIISCQWIFTFFLTQMIEIYIEKAFGFVIFQVSEGGEHISDSLYFLGHVLIFKPEV
jgi:hypothetical protein